MFRHTYNPLRELLKASLSKRDINRPWLVRALDLVRLARGISTRRGETSLNRAMPLSYRIHKRLKDPRHLGSLAAFLIFSAELHMPEHIQQWSLAGAWPAILAGIPLGYLLWALYELGVLWASEIKIPGDPRYRR
ncbi:MAG TPA: hypothetical protein VFL97_04615 [Nitrococcus sp.]|nr:hypothetical protein [Nitrococcus sp.]